MQNKMCFESLSTWPHHVPLLSLAMMVSETLISAMFVKHSIVVLSHWMPAECWFSLCPCCLAPECENALVCWWRETSDRRLRILRTKLNAVPFLFFKFFPLLEKGMWKTLVFCELPFLYLWGLLFLFSLFFLWEKVFIHLVKRRPLSYCSL